MAIQRKYRLNLRNYGNLPAIMLSQYDEGYDLVFEIYDGPDAAESLSAYTVKLCGTRRDTLKYELTGTIANNVLSFPVDTTMSACDGKGVAEIEIIKAADDTKFAMFNLPVFVEKAAVPNDAVDADVERAQEIAEQVQELIDGATYGAEAWATGQKNGVDVETTDPTYHNNSKYYAEQAQEIADSIGIDATLSITGKAADAKKTGDEISSLKEDLNADVDLIKLKIGDTTIDFKWVQGEISESTGADVASNNRIRTDGYYPVQSGAYIVIPVGYGYRLFRYDANKTFIDYVNWYYGDRALDFSTAEYFRIVIRKNPDTTVVPSDGENIVVRIGEYNNNIDKNTENIAELDSSTTTIGFLQDNTEIDGFSRSIEKTNLISTATKTEGYFRSLTKDTASTAYNYYTKSVSEGDIIHIKGHATGTAYLYYLYDANDNLVGYYPKHMPNAVTENTFAVPSGVSYIVANERIANEFIFELITGVHFTSSAPSTGEKADVIAVRSGTDLQVRSTFHDKIMAITANLTGSQNGGFNLSNYHILDSEPTDEATIATGTLYKGAADDICPIHYNGSYVGANHGKSPTWKIKATSHGLTVADIGSVWASGNKQYVIYRIDDSDYFSVIGDADDSYYGVVITTPTSPLTHVSGATHTSNITFTSATSQQMYPAFKGYSLSIANNDGVPLVADGVIKGDSIIVCESYDIFDAVSIVEYLKANVGDNTNASYYDDSIDANMRIRNTYTFLSSGAMVVACNAIPLKAGVYLEYWGGVQSGAIGDDYYAPFTSNDTIQTQGNSSVNLVSSTWDDAQFPAYKMYQFDTNGNGFAVGYVIDYGQGLPANRYSKLTGNNGAGFWYGSSHKMYPHFFDVPLGTDFYGSYLSFYAFRSPVKNVGNFAKVQYEVDKDAYVEAEFFASQVKSINVGEKYNNRKITVVKKDSTISVLSDIVTCGMIDVSASGSGSLTIKLS